MLLAAATGSVEWGAAYSGAPFILAATLQLLASEWMVKRTWPSLSGENEGGPTPFSPRKSAASAGSVLTRLHPILQRSRSRGSTLAPLSEIVAPVASVSLGEWARALAVRQRQLAARQQQTQLIAERAGSEADSDGDDDDDDDADGMQLET